MTNFESVKNLWKLLVKKLKKKLSFQMKNYSLRYDLIKEELDELKEALIIKI
jgi:hypothetical protein